MSRTTTYTFDQMSVEVERLREENERLREALKEAKAAMLDYADATAYRILSAALAATEENP